MQFLQQTPYEFFAEEDMKYLKRVSIVVPTKDEEGSIQQLIERVDAALTKNKLLYEIIVVDDFSTDNTRRIVQWLKGMYPIRLYKKIGKPGKAQSLLEGFTYASYPILCMIDADLQYPPEAIPLMVRHVQKGTDIVVANRHATNLTFIRKFTHDSFLHVFGKYLYGFSCDVQSGLKVFRKEIVERISINPSPWTFDLEFLSKARDGGYSIGSIPIPFYKRVSGRSKVHIFKTSIEIAMSAIKQRVAKSRPIPFHPHSVKQKGKGFHFKGKEFVTLTDLPLMETAFYRLSSKQRSILIVSGIFAFLACISNPHLFLTTLIAIITILYFSDLLFQLFLIIKSFSSDAEIVISDKEIEQPSTWPTYTILCPLYKESAVLPQFISAISNLNYPKDKLQAIILLEEDDKETIRKVKKYFLPSFIQVIIAPNSNPKTKPKALNFGLQFAKGEYLVVYDAEDIPDPDQLKKVVIGFNKVSDKTVCIQAKLNFYNPHQNFLTRIFTAEYSLWFDLILTGLQAIKAPIPLGGTSNHFKTKNIQLLKGWDAFNVTEDCDLGIRLAKEGYNTAIINSTTLEEANSELGNWFRQRGRWIKGYMQTYLVHMRNIFSFLNLPKKYHAAIFQIIVGGRIFSLLINPFLWITTIAYFADRAQFAKPIESFFPTPILYIGTLSFIFGNFLYLYYYMIGAAKRQQYSIIKYALFTPFYWLLMSITAWLALYKIVMQPHYWAKTKHGLHLKKDKKISISFPKGAIDKHIFVFPKISFS